MIENPKLRKRKILPLNSEMEKKRIVKKIKNLKFKIKNVKTLILPSASSTNSTSIMKI
jgi:hypothetical protein